MKISVQNAKIHKFAEQEYHLKFSTKNVNKDIYDYTCCHPEPSVLSVAEGAAKDLYRKDASLRSA